MMASSTVALSCILVFLSIILVNAADEFSREITTSYNPDCPQCSSLTPTPHLMYTRAVSDSNEDDVMHFIVSAGGALGPLTSVLIRSTGKNSRLAFNWTNLLSSDVRSNGVKLENGKPVFQAAFVVTKLWEYNDTSDQGNMTKALQNQTFWHEWDTDQFMWTINSTEAEIAKTHAIKLTANSTVSTEPTAKPTATTSPTTAETTAKPTTTSAPTTAEPTVKVTTTAEPTAKPTTTTASTTAEPTANPNTTTAPTTAFPTSSPTSEPKPILFHPGSKLQFHIRQSGSVSRPSQQPSLEFTGNSTQIDVILDQLISSFKGSRFAISVVQLVSIANSSSSMDVKVTKSVDDEFTPGIFKMYDWNALLKTMDASTKNNRSFFQWKPVCYTSPERHLKLSQQMFNYDPETLDNTDASVVDRSIISSLTGFLPMGTKDAMNISFGQSGDGFYKASNYIAWTASMGLGKPPMDQISILVILVIVIGLGLPFIFLILGSIYICVRRRTVPPQAYDVIN